MINCVHCGKSTKSPKFCSRLCCARFYSEAKLTRWLAGENIEQAWLPKIIRDYLYTEAHNKCSSPTCCVRGGWSGVNVKSGKTVLTIDHIDGNAANNTRSNLRVLCPNCHALTETFGALNKGQGRTWRYKPK